MTGHIVLFLQPNINIDFKVLAEQLYQNYKELGEPIFLDHKLSSSEPLFIFNKNKELIIDGNKHHITITLYNDYLNMKIEVIKMIWDAFDYCDLSFKRVGYIKEIQKTNVDLEYTKKQLFANKLSDDVNEFQIGFQRIIKFQRKNINCWRRFVKFYDTPLIISYDINTNVNNIKDINYKILQEFLNFSDEFIEEDLPNYLKEN